MTDKTFNAIADSIVNKASWLTNDTITEMTRVIVEAAKNQGVKLTYSNINKATSSIIGQHEGSL